MLALQDDTFFSSLTLFVMNTYKDYVLSKGHVLRIQIFIIIAAMHQGF